MSEPKTPPANAVRIHHGNLLNAAVRRDIADLNRLYLAHAIDPVHRADSWFQLPSQTLAQLEHAPPEALERTACAPVALFELALPSDEVTSGWTSGAVGDAERRLFEPAPATHRRLFGLQALAVVRRLAEGVPCASRIAFGLGSACEGRLSALTPSEAFRLASWDGLVRPRWSAHPRCWSMLANAAARHGKDDLCWAYSASLCMLGPCEREPLTVRPLSGRRARSAHRRGPPGGSDVPC
ncbi:MAG: hypothetical protein RL033_1359 [Pseudomonadota bacterium]